MAVTEDQYKDEIAGSLKKDTDQSFMSRLAVWWEMHAPRRATGGLYLQYLYTRRQAIQFVLTTEYDAIDYSDADVSEQLQQQFENLKTLLDTTDEEIAQRQQNLKTSRGTPVVGEMAGNSPMPGFAGAADPNDPRYRGDARRPGTGPQRPRRYY